MNRLYRILPVLTVLLSIAAFGQTPRVVISEIMYMPQSGAPEWFELYNADANPVNLKNWRMSDATASRPLITTLDFILAPNSYVVISKDSTILTAFPEVAGHLIVANVPSLNNTGDDVAIYLPDTTLVERIPYATLWGGSTGKSLERKDPTLSGSDGANWGTAVSARGATPASKNSISPVDFDLEVRSVNFTPVQPQLGETVTATVTIANNGLKVAASFSLTAHDDLNRNGTGEANELIATQQSTQPLASKQSTDMTVSIAATAASNRQLIFTATFTGDELPTNNSRLESLVYGAIAGAVVINEILYAPSSGEPEWIELLNTTANSISLKNWEIADNATRVPIIEADSTLAPNEFLVLTKSAAIASYHATVGRTIVVSNLPSLNNGGDEVRLFDARGMRMDSVRFEPDWGGASNGASLERIDASALSIDKRNWNSSTDAEQSTPGRANSIRMLDVDAAITSLGLNGRDVSVTVKNLGKQLLSNLIVTVYNDRNRDSIATSDERITTPNTIAALARGDSSSIVFLGADSLSGVHQLIGIVEANSDERPANNVKIVRTVGGFQPGILTVNEILFAPTEGNAEYVEFFNRTSGTIDVQAWKLADQPTASGRSIITLTEEKVLVPAGGFLVIASDSSVLQRFSYLQTPSADRVLVIVNRSSLSLNSDADDVVLIDPTGKTIDSVRYSSKWHNPNLASTAGISLERINPNSNGNHASSWSSCAITSGGTPGLQNSIFAASPPPSASSISFTSNPFSPDGDGYEDFTMIRWHVPASVAQVRIRLFDTQGRMVRTIANNTPTGTSGEIVFDGLDDNKQRLRIGMYIVLLEGMDISNSDVFAKKAVLVVASKL